MCIYIQPVVKEEFLFPDSIPIENAYIYMYVYVYIFLHVCVHIIDREPLDIYMHMSAYTYMHVLT